MLKKIFIALFATSLVFSCNTVKDEKNINVSQPAVTSSDSSGNSSAYPKKVSSAGMNFEWTVNGNSLQCKLSAPTSGWVAVGFNPSTIMKDANIIIGYVNNGQASIRDDFGSTMFVHEDDTAIGGTDNITDKKGTENNGTTEISFTIPLDSGDSKDQKLVAGQSCKVIFSYGPEDNFTSMHARTGKANITL